MPVYVDKIFEADPLVYQWRNPRARQAARWGTRWCHMWASSAEDLEQLHEIAERIGLRRAYFQNKPRFPHYDLVPSKRALAIKEGAVEIELREWLRDRLERGGACRTGHRSEERGETVGI